jgi:hypothetical protein
MKSLKGREKREEREERVFVFHSSAEAYDKEGWALVSLGGSSYMGAGFVPQRIRNADRLSWTEIMDLAIVFYHNCLQYCFAP